MCHNSKIFVSLVWIEDIIERYSIGDFRLLRAAERIDDYVQVPSQTNISYFDGNY